MANQPCCANPKIGRFMEIYSFCGSCNRLLDEFDSNGKKVNYREAKLRKNREAKKRDKEQGLVLREPK